MAASGNDKDLKPRITVIGVGGAGCNAVNNMIASGLDGVEFIVCNTDAQALNQASPEIKIQLGLKATQGLGAGSSPELGKLAAEETIEEVMSYLRGTNMLFVTAGMGGGTGTGGAPVIAKAARDIGILTVGVVTKPFHFEGSHRMSAADRGIEEMHQCVDTLLVIPNQNLFRIATERTTFAEAFAMADDVLHSGVRTFTDLMIKHGLINLDFADISAVMKQMIGKAMMGTGQACAERRAIEAAEAAISCPLLDDVSMRGARAVLINITGGLDMTLFEVDEAANRIREEVDPHANIIFGATFDEKMSGQIRVSVVATGIDAKETHSILEKKPDFKAQTTSVLRSTLFAQKSSPFFSQEKDEQSSVPDEEPDLFEQARRAPSPPPGTSDSSFSDKTWGRKHDLFSFEYRQGSTITPDLKEAESPFRVAGAPPPPPPSQSFLSSPSSQSSQSSQDRGLFDENEEKYFSAGKERGLSSSTEPPRRKPLNFFERLTGAGKRGASLQEGGGVKGKPQKSEDFKDKPPKSSYDFEKLADATTSEERGAQAAAGHFLEKDLGPLETDSLDIPTFLRYQNRKEGGGR